MAQWREDDLEDKVERGLNTGPDRAGYENMNVAGYAKLVEKRSYIWHFFSISLPKLHRLR